MKIIKNASQKGLVPSPKKHNLFARLVKPLRNASSGAGFTMIELLVAMSLFVIVISIASGIFVYSLRTQKALVDLLAINDNASLVIEQMAREIRVGNTFSGGGAALNFINALGEAVTYSLSDGAILRKTQPITGSNVKVENLQFVLSGEGVGAPQTRVTIILKVGSRSPRLEGFTTDIQTTISPRELDS